MKSHFAQMPSGLGHDLSIDDWISPSRVNVVIRGIDLVLNRDEVLDLIEALDLAFDDGP